MKDYHIYWWACGYLYASGKIHGFKEAKRLQKQHILLDKKIKRFGGGVAILEWGYSIDRS